ncbi:MAG: carboxylesterase family protein, partial [Actinobacteria bacterium]|nr:carboxylesterase family protein [Actinomycetota bacterium]
RAPRPAATWHGVRAATSVAPACPQPASPFSPSNTSENCLYLNVYTPPAQSLQHRGDPVLVWFHGGGFTLGQASDYDPTKMAADGAIVVTVNYRLGVLGFLAHPALAGRPGGPAGNFGLMDQQAALRWVRANIHAFGGDPHRITIDGQSAGGLSVLAQLTSPGARGLFQRAIVQSGSFALRQQTLATAEAAGATFAARVGCSDQTASCLRSVPVSELVANESPSATPGVIDGKVLRQSIGTALAKGQFDRVPIIDGTNHDEERLFGILGSSVSQGESVALPEAVSAASYQDVIAKTFDVSAQTAAEIAAEYPLDAFATPALAYSQLDSDANFSCPALQIDHLTSRYVPTYAYEFNDENAPSRYVPGTAELPSGAMHQSELQYLFDTPTAPIPGQLSPAQEALASSMRQHWVTFAATGDPSYQGSTAWPAFDAGSEQFLALLPPQPQLETSFAADHHCGFWSRLR